MYFLYILRSKEYPKTYVGITDNLDRRLTEHNAGKSAFSRRYKPWSFVHHEQFLDRLEARKKERYYKSAAGRKIIKKILHASHIPA